jgi:endonuclease/exonuclease/phosphatase family metal-dependent hydrolase
METPLFPGIPKAHCVVMGDFNMEPNNPILKPITQRLHVATIELDA